MDFLNPVTILESIKHETDSIAKLRHVKTEAEVIKVLDKNSKAQTLANEVFEI